MTLKKKLSSWKSEWKNGQWTVMISRPLKGKDDYDD